LARLNRIYPDKTKTFVLDFQNTMEDVKEAFAPFFEATELEERTDLNQIYDLESRISGTHYILKDEVDRFAEQFYKGNLSTQDRLQLEGLVKQAVTRFEYDEDESQQEEFRQLLISILRFYSFVAQVVALNDPWLEKLYVYGAWLSKLLPSRDLPADINITEDMLTLDAFKLQKSEEGSASLNAGETEKLLPITEFGANAYTEEEEKSLSEIIDSFNERHGTSFSREDFLRFERVNKDIMDDDMKEMMRNNPADVVYTAFSQAFFQGMVRMFQNDREMQSIVLKDPAAREMATKHFFKRAQREARENQ